MPQAISCKPRAAAFISKDICQCRNLLAHADAVKETAVASSAQDACHSRFSRVSAVSCTIQIVPTWTAAFRNTRRRPSAITSHSSESWIQHHKRRRAPQFSPWPWPVIGVHFTLNKIRIVKIWVEPHRVEFTQFLTLLGDGEPVAFGRTAVCNQDGQDSVIYAMRSAKSTTRVA